jgi:hypothetical protein
MTPEWPGPRASQSPPPPDTRTIPGYGEDERSITEGRASSEAAMGRLMAVASMKIARTNRLFPATPLALQVKSDQAIQMRVKRGRNSPNPSRGVMDQMKCQPREGEYEAQVGEELRRVGGEVFLATRYRYVPHWPATPANVDSAVEVARSVEAPGLASDATLHGDRSGGVSGRARRAVAKRRQATRFSGPVRRRD